MPFTCPRCNNTSHHPKDEEHGYCGNCHDFTGQPEIGDAIKAETLQELFTALMMRGLITPNTARMVQASVETTPLQPRLLPCPVCGGEAIHAIDVLERTVIKDEINRFETVKAGVIDWKLEAERANRHLSQRDEIDVLPCDVHLPPNTYLRRGVAFRALMQAFKVRQSKPPHEMVFAEETEGGLRNAQDDVRQILGKLTDTTSTSEAELQLWFDLRQAADQMAIAKWRSAHPGELLAIPDHADLVIWLLDQLASVTPCGHCKRTDGLHESWCRYAVVAARLMRVDTSLAKRVGNHIAQQSRLKGWLSNWLRCYSLDIFPEPDLAKAAEVLKANGMTLDSLSAQMARHVISRVIEALDDPEAL